MIQVNVTNLKTNQIGWGAQFPDQPTANAWIADCESKYMWGMPARTLTADVQGKVIDLNGSTPDLSSATSTGTTTDNAGDTINTYTFAADYSVVQTDITVQVQKQQAVQTALQNQSVGAVIIANVAALNESKLAASTMTQQTFTALLADQNVLNIERLLWNGSLVTAKALVQSSNLTAYYTADEVSSILALFP